MIDRDSVTERLEKIFTKKKAEQLSEILFEIAKGSGRKMELFTVSEVAQSLRLSESMIRKAAGENKIRCVRFGPKGGRIRFTPEQVADYIAANTEGGQ